MSQEKGTPGPDAVQSRPAGSPDGRIPELESLRGVMAWWVVIGHCICLTTADVRVGRRIWNMFGDGTGAVDVFMILSGFVITHLLRTKRESWGLYIARRFFRIFPLYAVCLVGALGTVSWQREGLATIAGDSPYLAETLRRFDAGLENPAVVLPVKFTMLHGLPPESLVHDAASAYLGPGWSISTEWMFYLIAPGFIALAESGIGAAGASILIAVIAIASRGLDNRAFVGKFAHLFFVGALCAQGYLFLRSHPGVGPMAARVLPWALSLFAGFIWSTTAQWPLGAWPITAWILCYWAILSREVAGEEPVGRAIRKCLGSSPLRLLGRISYSTYLVHVPILYILVGWIERADSRPKDWALLIRLIAIGTPLILLMSLAAFHWVEKPGIRLGKRLLSR